MDLNPKKSKIITIFTLILLIVNIIVSAFIFLDIQIINAPETEVFIDIIDVNSEEVILDAKLKMYNSNGFDIGIKDFTVTTMNFENEELGTLKISGGNIPSLKSKTFNEIGKIVLKKSNNLTVLKNRITGEISVNLLGFIKKTIPVDLMIYVSVEKIFENLEIPTIKTNAYFTDLSEKGIEFTAEINISNPTSLIYNIDNLFLDFITENGVSIGNINIEGGTVEPKKTQIFYSKGIVNYDAFNFGILNLNLKGIAGAKIAGLNKNISFSTDTSIIIPDIKDFVFRGKELDFEIPVQIKLKINGILCNVGFSMYNPSNVSIIGKNLNCSIYRQDNEYQTLIGKKLMDSCEFHSGERICVKTEINIPYIDYLSSGSFKLIPDWIILRIEGNFYIAGTNQSFPLALNAYIDPNVIGENDFI